MDAQMESTVTLSATAYPTWDFVYADGCVPYIEDVREEDQRAEIACFVQKGLIPQLPAIGSDWLAFFMKRIAFADLDSQIRQMLISTESTKYVPAYSASDDLLIVTVQRSEQ